MVPVLSLILAVVLGAPNQEPEAKPLTIPGKSVKEWARLCDQGVPGACAEVEIRTVGLQPTLATAKYAWPWYAVVEKLGQQTLRWLAQNHSNVAVRMAAIERVQDQPTLEGIATRAPEPLERSAAVRRIENRALLARIARKDKDEIVRAAALERTTDQRVLIEAALDPKENPRTRSILLDRIESRPDVFKKIAMEKTPEFDHRDPQQKALVRVAADQQLVADYIWKYSLKGYCRSECALLKDQTLVKKIVETHPNELVVGRVAENATDPLLQEWALGGSSTPPIARSYGVARTGNMDAVNEALRKDPVDYVRVAAARRSTDQELLARVLKMDSSAAVRLVAAKRVDNPSVLITAVDEDADKAVVVAAAERVEARDFLVRWAEHHRFSEVRAISLKKLKDPDLTYRVWQKDHSVEAVAAEQVLAQEKLIEILKYATQSETMHWAFTKLSREKLADLALDPGFALPLKGILNELAQGDGKERFRNVFETLAFTGVDQSVRGRAVQYLLSLDIVRKVAEADAAPAVRLTAVRRLPAEDPVRVKLAMSDPDRTVRGNLAGTRNQAVLVQLLSSQYTDVRLYAIRGTNDVDLLMKLAASDPDPEVRKSAAERAAYVRRNPSGQ